MARSFDFNPLQRIGLGTIGPPGSRQFFLRASGGGETVVLNCEKFHVQGLVTRIQQLLEAQGADAGPELDVKPPPPPAQPGEAEWSVGELGLGYHESKDRFVVVARELGPAEATHEELATARFWATAEQVRMLARQAEGVLAGGRPTCTYCGLPIDPSGHPCPAANGSRPIF